MKGRCHEAHYVNTTRQEPITSNRLKSEWTVDVFSEIFNQRRDSGPNKMDAKYTRLAWRTRKDRSSVSAGALSTSLHWASMVYKDRANVSAGVLSTSLHAAGMAYKDRASESAGALSTSQCYHYCKPKGDVHYKTSMESKFIIEADPRGQSPVQFQH